MTKFSIGKEERRLLKDKSNFSTQAIKKEWSESNRIEFDANLLHFKNTNFLQKIDHLDQHLNKTRTLQINILPIYPPLECEEENCFELADYSVFILPGPSFSIPNYIAFPKDDLEHKISGTATFVCEEHLNDFIEFSESFNSKLQ